MMNTISLLPFLLTFSQCFRQLTDFQTSQRNQTSRLQDKNNRLFFPFLYFLPFPFFFFLYFKLYGRRKNAFSILIYIIYFWRNKQQIHSFIEDTFLRLFYYFLNSGKRVPSPPPIYRRDPFRNTPLLQEGLYLNLAATINLQYPNVLIIIFLH